jgi:hypothetical protein
MESGKSLRRRRISLDCVQRVDHDSMIVGVTLSQWELLNHNWSLTCVRPVFFPL